MIPYLNFQLHSIRLVSSGSSGMHSNPATLEDRILEQRGVDTSWG